MRDYWVRTWPYHVLLLPAVILCLIFSYVPMFGLVIAFQNYEPWMGIFGSEWVGLEQFRYLFSYPDSVQVIVNTLIIATAKLVFQLVVPIIFALMLNELRKMLLKRVIQTLVYLPHFISWVVLGGILIDILGTGGIVNRFLGLFGVEPIFFLGNGDWFRVTLVVSDVWKEFGFSAIIFLAALSNINPALYEAAEIDGATKWQQTMYVTLPSILPIIVVVGTLSLGRILDAGFDQILNLYNPLVYAKADIIDTFVYRVGLTKGEFSFGTAVGLFKSTVGFFLILLSYWLAYRIANYRIF
ncbi:ABC transporter permease [Paenibacillus chartarius]|uniref:ABC transporter permease n=1 Tax=Paenibacillus chartarius TaxID=747481 RepID=A0ABV6DLW9_9BACL